MSIEHSILAVISLGPSSGYDIKAEFEHKAAGLFWGISYGSIYPKLKKLEEEGFIKTVETSLSSRKKTLYELTGKGWRELENWLRETPEYPVIKDELFMKIAAWHEYMETSSLLGHLRERRAQSADLLEFVTEWPENGVSYISGVGRLGINYAKMRLEAEINWIDETVRILEENILPKGQDPSGLGEKLKERRLQALKGEDSDEG